MGLWAFLRKLLASAPLEEQPPWPPDLPRLYPHISGPELCDFLTEEQYREILQFPLVKIFPFFSEKSGSRQALFGIGLHCLLVRDLMLVRTISVRGPEDVPVIPREEVRLLAQADRSPRNWYVTGAVELEPQRFHLELEAWQEGRLVGHRHLSSSDFREFLYQCAEAIAGCLGHPVEPEVAQLWSVGRPCKPESLVVLGNSYLDYVEDDVPPEAQYHRVCRLMDQDRSLAWVAGCLSQDVPQRRSVLLEGFRRDPYDPQLCFVLGLSIWGTKQWDPEALQFFRRAVELSPGHGKAHMCALQVFHPDYALQQRRHAELAYRLLPGNAFAVNVYVHCLWQQGAPMEMLIPLLQEAIQLDPENAQLYLQMIDLYCGGNDYRTALEYAHRLLELFEPVPSQRAIVCLKQSPQIAAKLRAGTFDPAEYVRSIIRWLEQRLQEDASSHS